MTYLYLLSLRHNLLQSDAKNRWASALFLGSRAPQEIRGEENGREKVCERHEDPHQGACTLLVLQSRHAELPRDRKIFRINHAIAKGEVRRKCVARQGGQEQVQNDGPLRMAGRAGPRRDYRPPEQQSGDEEACVFNFVPKVRLQA